MAVFHKDKIRNIALIGHGGEGKTSLLEVALSAAGIALSAVCVGLSSRGRKESQR